MNRLPARIKWSAFAFFFFMLFTAVDGYSQTCNNWLRLPAYQSYVSVGDLDVAGDKITVEAMFMRTEPYAGGQVWAGDLVSKHNNPPDCNYLLRPNNAEITTTNGYFRTPDICEIELNKMYHAAMVYDGTTLKFYRNGFLMSSVPVTGNMFQNNFQTRIGLYDALVHNTQLLGYINEVRIWNVARTQAQIRASMSTSLLNPATQTGLLAYYTFNDLTNKQGNVSWNGVLGGSASINAPIPNCNFVADSCVKRTQCNNWLSLPSLGSKVSIGDLDVTGNQLTVEAMINRVSPLNSGLYWGHLVSKHTDASNVNYALSPNGCEITTSISGYRAISTDCPMQENRRYHVAMVYNGLTLRYYRDGFLLGEVACTGTMVTNDLIATIGQVGGGTDPFNNQFLGYVNEVRVWNVARSQTQLRAFMDGSLPNPTTQPGLMAYYTFDNLLNKQGNTNWNGTLSGAAVINQVNPVCEFIAEPCEVPVTTIIPDFNIPDTVCVNTPVAISNNTIGASSYYWNFCVADIAQAPVGTNLGNPNGLLSQPVFMDYVLYNNNYYGFSINHFPGKLIRLDFGNSLLNTPTAIDMGNFGGIIPPGYGAEGIQIVQNEGQWYAIIVGGYTPSGSTPRILKVEFGPNLLNPAPIATDWGNIGNMLQPLDLHLFKEDGQWYGLTINGENNSLTMFNFTNSFINTPTAVNLGTFGLLDYPTGVYAINDNGNWHVFVTNSFSNGRLVRLDFGNSLLNTPTAVNLGTVDNAGGLRDLTIIKYCDQITGFAVNATTNSIYRLDFASMTSVPVVTNLGNTGNLSTPHSISRLFRVNQDLYGFITNVGNNSITRLKFSGCTNSSLPSSTLQNPAAVSYNAPGIYNINLTIDDGLPTQNSRCKKVVVMELPHLPIKNFAICQGDSIRVGPSIKNAGYAWNNGTNTDSLTIKTGGIYWVDASRYGCVNRDSFNVTIKPTPSVFIGNDTTVCVVNNLPLNATTAGATYAWNNGSSSSSIQVNTTGTFYVTVTVNACKVTDTIKVFLFPKPVITTSNDTTICNNTPLQLFANGGASYSWSPPATLNNAGSPTPVATPTSDTRYYVTVTDINNCKHLDSVDIAIRPAPSFTISGPRTLCINDTVRLNAAGGSIYAWQPAGSLNNASASNPIASPVITTDYSVTITETVCNESKTLFTRVTVLPLPVVTATRSNDLDCSNDQSQLQALGAKSYSWSPANTLDNPSIFNPVATPVVTTQYIVAGTDPAGCTNYDTVIVKVDNINKGGYLMPNAFTPNNDGLNDCYGIKYWGVVQEIEFSIFNRWGERIFFTRNAGDCWDGTYKGKPQDGGVFVYMVKAKTFCENSIFRKGTFVLVR